MLDDFGKESTSRELVPDMRTLAYTHTYKLGKHTYKLGKHTYMLGKHTYLANIYTCRCMGPPEVPHSRISKSWIKHQILNVFVRNLTSSSGARFSPNIQTRSANIHTCLASIHTCLGWVLKKSDRQKAFEKAAQAEGFSPTGRGVLKKASLARFS